MPEHKGEHQMKGDKHMMSKKQMKKMMKKKHK